MNTNETINKLLAKDVSWLEPDGNHDDIAICSRIRLARNIEGISFPIVADADQRSEICDMIKTTVINSECLDKPEMFFKMNELSALHRKLLLERRLISNELSGAPQGSALIVADGENSSIMINEEDHLRLQVLYPGLDLEQAWLKISHIDDCLSERLAFAYDSRLGYLTSCPSNIGTGIRASVMLHLPGLILSEQINAAMHGIRTLGLTVRGIYGEGSENHGGLFQISNQSTLGESELMIIERLTSVIRQLITHEKNARVMMLEHNKHIILNHVGRAYGRLRHAFVLGIEEALNSLSALRMGVDLKMFTALDIRTINDLFIKINPAHLLLIAGKPLNDLEQNIKRADVVRETLRRLESEAKN
ncbi:MAG: protein arginine kinase [Victivallaceae bacterium]|nr:protein arginine kinase [Victivallaceae bacterium]